MERPGQILEVYGFLESMTLSVSHWPITAVARFTLKGESHTFEFLNPQPLEPLMHLFQECWCIEVIDRNISESNQLEFGRYKLGIGGEDGPEVEVMLDDYAHSVGPNQPLQLTSDARGS